VPIIIGNWYYRSKQRKWRLSDFRFSFSLSYLRLNQKGGIQNSERRKRVVAFGLGPNPQGAICLARLRHDKQARHCIILTLFLISHHVSVLARPEELPLSRRADGDALLVAVLLRGVGQERPEWQIQVGRALQHVIGLQAGPG